MDARYLRISQDPAARNADADDRARLADLNSSLTGQRRECRAVETRMGATDAAEYVDHDISATAGKLRPGYQSLMAAIERGQVKRVIVLHLSRLWRNRRERAVGIEVMRRHGVTVVAAKGPTLDMATATGRSMAAMLGEIDTMESELKSERLEDWHTTRAERGLHSGGPAPFGYRYESTGRVRADGRAEQKLTRTPEARQVADWYRTLLAGGSLWSICRAAGVTPATMRQRLASGTYAGIRVHKGLEYELRQPDGRKFPAVVSVDTWRAVKALLDSRKVGPRRTKTLLAGIAVCDRCGRTVLSGAEKRQGKIGHRMYRCLAAVGGCSRMWRAPWLDTYVEGLVRERLSRKDLAGLLATADNADVAELLDEAQGIRARLRGLATDSVLKGVDVSDAVAAAKVRLAEIERITAPQTDEVLAPLARAAKPIKVYDSYTDVSQRQAVIRALMTVRLLTPPRGRWPHRDDEEAQMVWYVDSCVQIGAPS